MLIDKLQDMSINDYITSFADNPERVFEDVQEIVSATEKKEFDEYFIPIRKNLESINLGNISLDEKAEIFAIIAYSSFKAFFFMRLQPQISVMRYYHIKTTKSHHFISLKLSEFVFHNASSYEKRVLGAIYEIGKNGNKITPTRIYKTLKQDDCYKPSKAQLDKVKEALHILDGIEVNPKRLEPFTSTVSPEHLTDSNLKIEEFFHKVIGDSSMCEITYSDIYKACNAKSRSQKSRLSSKYRVILNQYKNQKIITDYVESETGIRIIRNNN